MKRSGQSHKIFNMKNYGAYLLVLIAVFAVSLAGSYFLLRGKFSIESDFIAEIESRHDKAPDADGAKDSQRLYGNGDQEAGPMDNTVLRKDDLLVAAEHIIREYVKPYNTRLMDLYMDQQGIIYIDFGDEIARNFKGDASEEFKVIAGLYDKVKQAVPGLSALKILIGGKEADSIGGHIDISKPIGEILEESI